MVAAVFLYGQGKETKIERMTYVEEKTPCEDGCDQSDLLFSVRIGKWSFKRFDTMV